ncbi:MAG: glycosyltransferase [Lachnospiraceae bacterium]
MKLLFAMNNFYSSSVGMAVSARRIAEELRSRGAEVRIVSGGMEGKPDYPLKKWDVPFFRKQLEAQRLYFAKRDPDLIREAVSWADLVHTFDPFPVSHQVLSEAYHQGKPRVGSFRFFPENLTCAVNKGEWDGLNHSLRNGFREYIFNYCDVIVCPSKLVKKYLTDHDFRKGRLEIIPSGIPGSSPEQGWERGPEDDGFRILTAGRLTGEKNQITLLRAAEQSEYADRIHITIAGAGQEEEALREEGAKLPNPPEIRLMSPGELREAAARSDLYAQCSLAETEGLACMESFADGCVPVIADAPLSASREHAIDARHLFPAGDPAALAERIDWWIEHPEELRRSSSQYRQYALTFPMERTGDRLMHVYESLLSRSGTAV